MQDETLKLAEKLGIYLSTNIHDRPNLPHLMTHSMLVQRHIQFCEAHGIDTYGLSEYEVQFAMEMALITDRASIYAFALQIVKYDYDECPVSLELLSNALRIKQLRVCFDIICLNMPDLDMYKLFTDEELELSVKVAQVLVYGGYTIEY